MITLTNKKDKSNPDKLKHETALHEKGFKHIIGVDECGRGPWAGHVTAGAVIMPKGFVIERLTDSKKLNKKEHVAFAEEVKKHALAYAIGEASVEEIDQLNIKKASQLAMKRAIENLTIKGDYVLVDGNEVLDIDIPQVSIIKGDYNSHTISAAAIIAKVDRDLKMAELDKKYDNRHGWASNAGYIGKKHKEACSKYGLTPYHRRSWKTSEEFINVKDE